MRADGRPLALEQRRGNCRTQRTRLRRKAGVTLDHPAVDLLPLGGCQLPFSHFIGAIEDRCRIALRGNEQRHAQRPTGFALYQLHGQDTVSDAVHT